MWDDSLLILNAEIDAQHKELVNHLEKLTQESLFGCSEEQLNESFKFVEEYTQKHFSYEEALMEQNNYPKLMTQQAQHDVFKQKIKELQDSRKRGCSSEQLADSIKWELLNWFKHHIKNIDKEMVNYINAQQPY